MLYRIDHCVFSEWTKILPKGCLVDRDKVIVDACAGKRVLHVGACDAPFALEKAKAGELLHQKIMQVADEIIGVDIDQSAINVLKSIGISDIIEADVCSDSFLEGEEFDVILCCDVIEHVSAPGPLIAACRRFMSKDSILIVTTINATAFKPALRAFLGRESVHNDHVAYFSYATLGKLLTLEGLRPVEFGTFAYPTINRFTGWVSQALMAAAPCVADGIFFSARRES